MASQASEVFMQPQYKVILLLAMSSIAMADSMPIPEPPRTPTPPPGEEQQPAGLGFDFPQADNQDLDVLYDANSLSPIRPEHNKMSSVPSTPFYTPERTSARSEDEQGPFNFQPATMAKSPVAVKSVGHSVSLRGLTCI